MTLMRWVPITALRNVEREMNRIFGELGPDRPSSSTDAPTPAWSPNVDVYDHEDHLELAVELPGVDPGKVEVSVDRNVLTIRGERRPADVKPEKVYQREGLYGPFERAFTLPATVNRDAIKAEYKDGVLRLTLPLAEQAKPRLIPLQPAA